MDTYEQMLLDALLEQGDIGTVGKQADEAQRRATEATAMMTGNNRMDWASQLARAISGGSSGLNIAEAKQKRSEASDRTTAFIKALRARQAAAPVAPVAPAPGAIVGGWAPAAPAAPAEFTPAPYQDASGLGLRVKKWPQGW